MSLDTEKVILIAILAGVMIFVIYFEWTIMRSRGRESRKVALEKDEAFNAVLTTRSVVIALQRQGTDTSKAQKLVDEAKFALQRGEYQRCKDLCDLAKSSLTKPGTTPAPKPSAVRVAPTGGPAIQDDSLLSVANEINASANRPYVDDKYTGTKLRTDDDGNYMSAKFEINTATASIKAASGRDEEVVVARGLLADAQKAFKAGSYTKALSLAVKARKSINAVPGEEAIKLRTSSKAEEEPEPVPPEEEVEERCESCGAPLEENDMFCHKCGAKVAYEKECAGCGATAKPEDVFCRKCGSKLD